MLMLISFNYLHCNIIQYESSTQALPLSWSVKFRGLGSLHTAHLQNCSSFLLLSKKIKRFLWSKMSLLSLTFQRLAIKKVSSPCILWNLLLMTLWCSGAETVGRWTPIEIRWLGNFGQFRSGSPIEFEEATVEQMQVQYTNKCNPTEGRMNTK